MKVADLHAWVNPFMYVTSGHTVDTKTALWSFSAMTNPPNDAAQRRTAKPIVCYEVEQLPAYDSAFYERARASMQKVNEVRVEPRDAATFAVPAGHFFRIVSTEGPQVGDLNLWNAHDLNERFFSGKKGFCV